MGPVIRVFLKIRNSLCGTGLGKIPGLAWLSERIYQTMAPEKPTLIVHRGIRMFVNPREGGLGSSLFSRGAFEESETRLFEKSIKPGMVVVDIGANIGYYSLIASGLVGRKGRVYAFEPEPKNHGILLQNIRENNFVNIVPVKLALSDRKGIARLYTDKSNEGGNSLSGTNVMDRQGSVDVQTTTMDSYFGGNAGGFKVDFIKIDVEGAEGLVFKGAKKVLKNRRLKIMMEFCPYFLRNMGTDPLGLLERMHALGFRIKCIDGETGRTMEMAAGKIAELCTGKLGGMGGVSLLLEK